MKKILANRIKCKLCGDVIESYSVHDFKWCSCKQCAVDGGLEYLKRCAKRQEEYIELSEFADLTDEDISCIDCIHWVYGYGMGDVCGLKKISCKDINNKIKCFIEG